MFSTFHRDWIDISGKEGPPVDRPSQKRINTRGSCPTVRSKTQTENVNSEGDKRKGKKRGNIHINSPHVFSLFCVAIFLIDQIFEPMDVIGTGKQTKRSV